MPPQQPNTAVLLFIRSGHEEARVKNFGDHLHHQSRCRIARLLNANARKVAASAGVPVVVVTGAQQRGSTFGQRFANAIESTFQLGYENVVAIGNDCLSLSQGHLKKAIQRLQDLFENTKGCRNAGSLFCADDQIEFHEKRWSFMKLT